MQCETSRPAAYGVQTDSMNCNERQLGRDQVGWAARYFLRSYALARRNPKSSAAAAYSSALSEVMTVFFLAPCLSIFGCVLITSLRWAPHFGHEHPNFSPIIAAIAVTLLAGTAGRAWFGRLFRKYRTNPDAGAIFDSEKDRSIALRQKWAILIGCGIVVPMLALVGTFWIG